MRNTELGEKKHSERGRVRERQRERETDRQRELMCWKFCLINSMIRMICKNRSKLLVHLRGMD